jgi:hypothetical protein
MQLPSWKAVTDVLRRWMDGHTNNGTTYPAATAKIKNSCYLFNHYTAVCVAHCPFLYFVRCTRVLGFGSTHVVTWFFLLWNLYIFIPSQYCIADCNTIPPFRWKPVFWWSTYLHCSCRGEVRILVVVGTLQGIWSLGTQERMSYRPVLSLEPLTFPSQERHGTVRKRPFWEPLCTVSVKWDEGTVWDRCKCSVVSGGCDLGSWRQSPFPSWSK